MFEQRTGHTYSEEVFRYLLRVERARGAQARRPVLLVLVGLSERDGGRTMIPRAVADEIFAGLWFTVRKIDFVGWFREGRIAAAVLAQGDVLPAPEECGRIAERITRALHQRLPGDIARLLAVQVRHVRPRRNGRAS